AGEKATGHRRPSQVRQGRYAAAACPVGRSWCVQDVQVRAVVSRVSTAAVTVDGEVVGEIGTGLLSLVGVGRDDDAARARALARKIHELRVFPTDDGARSAADLGLPVLMVS